MEGFGLLTSLARLSLPRVFWILFFQGELSLQTGPPPPLEWLSIPPLVAAALITTKGAQSPGSGLIGVIGALGFFPSEAV